MLELTKRITHVDASEIHDNLVLPYELCRVTFGIHFSHTERFLRWSVKNRQYMGSA